MIEDFRKRFHEALNLVENRAWLSEHCSEPGRLATFAVDLEQLVLQRYLESHGLPEALAELYDHQVFKGFVQDTLGQLRRIRIRARDSGAFFLAHCNPGRANRSAGAGRANPPPGIDLRGFVSPSCFLEEYNQKWQQRGLQLGYAITLDSEDHFCSCNPFPFGLLHTTIATSKHISQRWSGEADLKHVIKTVLQLGRSLPGWVVLFNGSRSAGASIPAHRHYQVFKLDDAQRPFPLELAVAAKSGSNSVVPLLGGVDYPMTCFCFRGSPDEIISHTVALASRWRSFGDGNSENIICITEAGRLALYYTPRDEFSHAARFSGAVACLEILGEFIFSGEQNIRALGEGAVDYVWLYDVLRDVAPPSASLLIGPVAAAAA